MELAQCRYMELWLHKKSSLCVPAPGLVTTKVLMIHRADSAELRMWDSRSFLWEMRALGTCEHSDLALWAQGQMEARAVSSTSFPKGRKKRGERHDLAHHLPAYSAQVAFSGQSMCFTISKSVSGVILVHAPTYVVPVSDTQSLGAALIPQRAVVYSHNLTLLQIPFWPP